MFMYLDPLRKNSQLTVYTFVGKTAYLGLGKMGTQHNLNTKTVGCIKVGLPPSHEIDQLINFIERPYENYDDFISHANKSIMLIQERHAALISATVSGKIDVRDWQSLQQESTSKEVAA